jgi:hypothetical protein
MVKFMKGALLAGVASLALASIASAQAVLTKEELKCQTSTSKAAAKFVGSKAKCAIKCQQNAAKAVNPQSDCYAPYAGTTLTCITEPTFRKGAEEKYEDAIRKACDPSFKAGTFCPNCFQAQSGDCTTLAADRVQTNEGQVDSFGPGVFCQGYGQSPTPPTKEELGCEVNTAKTLSKLVGSVNKCYDKCNGNAFKGLISASDCAPPASDPATSTCLSTAKSKAIAGVDKKCTALGAVALPDCDETNGTPDEYPDGAFWVNTVSTVIEGNVPDTYCGSPSGAFLN